MKSEKGRMVSLTVYFHFLHALVHSLKIHDLAVAGADALGTKKPTAGKRQFLQWHFAGASVPFKRTGSWHAMKKGPC
jgi:hypothetical protein